VNETNKVTLRKIREAEKMYNQWLKVIYPDIKKFVKGLHRDPMLSKVRHVENPRVVVIDAREMPGYTGYAFSRGLRSSVDDMMELGTIFPFNSPADTYWQFHGCIVFSSAILRHTLLAQKVSLVHEAIHVAGAIGHDWEVDEHPLVNNGWTTNYHTLQRWLYDTMFKERMTA
jgi:hypothetical protein